MSASKEVKSRGLPSLQYVADKVDMNPDTLHLWYKNRRKVFIAVVEGVKSIDKTNGVTR